MVLLGIYIFTVEEIQISSTATREESVANIRDPNLLH
jgi:hypothetical protein